jgi:hypothetical protein
MRRLGLASLVVASLAFAPAATSIPTASGLRGHVTLSPARPVCIEDDPCSKPAPGVLLSFRRDGRTIASVKTTPSATYRLLLAPGLYVVAAPRYQRGSGITPRTVRVLRGRIARVDLEIDTGIQ